MRSFGSLDVHFENVAGVKRDLENPNDEIIDTHRSIFDFASGVLCYTRINRIRFAAERSVMSLQYS